MIVGLGNPGREHADTRHNVGFMVADALAERWHLGRPRERYRGRLVEGRLEAASGSDLLQAEVGFSPENEPEPAVRSARARDCEPEAGGDRDGDGKGGSARESATVRLTPRVALLWPQTYMNEAGRSVGPARGALRLPLEHVLVVHDEIDLPFGEIRARLGGGLAGHNGLKSLRRELGGPDFARVRVGVGRPASSDPDVVSAYVLGRFREDRAQVRELVERAADRVQGIVLGTDPL